MRLRSSTVTPFSWWFFSARSLRHLGDAPFFGDSAPGYRHDARRVMVRSGKHLVETMGCELSEFVLELQKV